MTWQDFVDRRKAVPHASSPQEVEDLFRLIQRDLDDARIEALSADRRFATAYNAALILAKLAAALSGYRIVGAGHHANSFQSLILSLGDDASPLAAYFEICRLKRNQLDYDRADVATNSEVADMLHQVTRLNQMVIQKFQELIEPTE